MPKKIHLHSGWCLTLAYKLFNCFSVLDRYPWDNPSQRKSRRGRLPKHKVETLSSRPKRPKATSSYDDDADDDEGSDEDTPPPHKRRGRPKANVKNTTPSPRAKRGRPKSNARYEEDTEESEGSEEDTPPPRRSRGRPKATSASPSGHGLRQKRRGSESRGRGRPKRDTGSYIEVTKKGKLSLKFSS